MPIVLLDAGILVALRRADDPWHAWASDVLASLKPPLHTCEAVLAEAAYLLRKVPGAAVGVLDLVAEGKLVAGFRLDAEVLAVRSLMARYRSVPMSLADACLVRMTELEPRSTVVTLDSDFRIYRRGGRGLIPMITPS